MLSRDSISQTGQFFNRILPKYSRIPLLFTVVLNFSVYWGARAIAGGFIHHNIETSLDDMIPVVYPTVVIYFGCYIFWIIGYLYNAAMDKRHCYRFLMADWLAKAVCFICYVVYPTTNTRPEIVGSDIWAQLMRFLYSMDAADNLFPSIHCLVSWLCYIGIRGNKKVPQWIRTTFCICAILVVAADDGVMPQTVEAINHAKAAGVEIIVAVNKIDKPSANIDKVKQELSEYELIPEDWGGSTIFCPVSAHTKEGIDNLLEMILLTAEVLELKANPDRNARGLVIEAQLDKGRGAVATVLVQKGTLHVGDPIACGSGYGKVRAMVDDKGRRVKEAKPSTPVEILGLNSVPSAGETFVACDSEKEAKAFSDTYISEEKNKLIEDTKAKMSLDDLFSQIQSGNMKELDIIVKADVQGSVEAVKQSLVKLSNEEVVVKVIHGGVGAINESDVILASASNAIIIGFNVRPDPVAKATADREGVDIRLYKVIYNAIEDVSAAMKGMLDPVFEEKVIGHAEIRQIFKASGVGNIAGSHVLDGFMERGCRVRISREGEQIFEGDLASLKRFKDDVKEVKTGYECGLVFDGFNDIQEFDIVEAYKMVEVPR